ncbi:hypothetical protein [Mongoliibacter ruber]|uniref:Uncharacterized protein n=1 Tax=Mongoliibacter ruber TaxID=1750599 RepID=A0A2T0WLS2_9BACT|nr:hypothetical protein [Mongoliibacter ruber]PRY87653.1 hypothetical protein CLW00_106281 [Mongoliibacter ruber]
MTEEEFDLLDELYFVQHYSYLKETLAWEDSKLLETLSSLHQKTYIKCLTAPDAEIFDQVDFQEKGKELYYLATKKGLMEHNAI